MWWEHLKKDYFEYEPSCSGKKMDCSLASTSNMDINALILKVEHCLFAKWYDISWKEKGNISNDSIFIKCNSCSYISLGVNIIIFSGEYIDDSYLKWIRVRVFEIW